MAVDINPRAVVSNPVRSMTQGQISAMKPWKCNFPGCTYSTKQKTHLDVHVRLHDTDPEVRKPFTCTFEDCGYRATQSSTLKDHIQAKHTPEALRKFQCSLCPSRFASEFRLRAHIPQHLKEKGYKCDSCNFSTHSKGSLRSHIRAVHKTAVTFTCSAPGCDYSTTCHPNLNHHLKIHEPDPLKRRPLPCNVSNCNFRAYNPGHLKIHVETHHNPNRTREHICPLCSKAFYTHQVGRAHIKSVHTGENTFCCDKCEYKTYRSSNLRNHCRLVHQHGEIREKKFKCESCEHRTDSRVLLDLHQKSVHSSERKLQCDTSDCQFKTNYAAALRDHRLIHETDPERRFPYACTFSGCDFRRRLRSKLTKHLQNHKSCKKQLRCHSCENKYPDCISLNFHRDLVHKKICHRCPNCNYNARFKRNLKHHIRNQCRPGDTNEQEATTAAKSASVTHRLPIVILQKIQIKVF